MGPYYDTAVEIHQHHLREAENNRLRRLSRAPLRRRRTGTAQGVAVISTVIAVIALAGQLI